jgi:endonuclease YncB( thermonuclease family)
MRILATASLLTLFAISTFGVNAAPPRGTFACPVTRITDGDTFRCGKTRVRLYGIDAPELPGHCSKGRACTPGDPWASTNNLAALLRLGGVQCRTVDVDRYGRTVALCSAGGADLSCSQLAGGFAVRRYGSLFCR